MNKVLRLLKLLVGIVVYLFCIANILIMLSGKFYIYSGVYHTYLKGRTGPFLYDLKENPAKVVNQGSGRFYVKKQRSYPPLSDSQKLILNKYQSTSFLVYKENKLVYEWYASGHNRKTASNSFSMAKSLVSLLIGIAIQENKINSVNDPISKYLPSFNKYGRSKITIENLLTMSSGLDWEESGKNPLSENAEAYYGNDVNSLALHQRMQSKPGKVFSYQSGNTQLLAMVLKKATGRTVSEYANEMLWSKLIPESPIYWTKDRMKGNERAFCCVHASSRDYGLLGQLILNGGMFNNEQIVPKSYLNQAFEPAKLISNKGMKNTRYGYHVWTYHTNDLNCNYFLGLKGQYVIVLPRENIVIIRTGHARSIEYGIGHLFRECKEGNSLECFSKIGHPLDLFQYIRLARKLVKNEN